MSRWPTAAAVVMVVGLAGLLLVLGPATTAAQAQADPAAQSGQIESFSFRGPVQERRFHGLVSNMRCLDNPELSLAESTTPQAREMRLFVFSMLQDDRVDFEIRNAMVDRYGQDVLYQSAFAGHRLLIWAGPVVLLFLGLIAAFIVSMRKRQAA